MAPSFDAVHEKLRKCGQEHLLAFHDSLSEPERASLLDQLDRLNVDRVTRICQKSLRDLEHTQNHDPHAADLRPLPDSSFASVVSAEAASSAKEWAAEGLRQIAMGTVAAVVMAGGQGTRLGSPDPKGCYDINLPSHKSLFQLQAERIARLQEVAADRFGQKGKPVVIPWYIMTSGPTREATEKFFKQHNFFGLASKNVIFFEQGTLPCFTFEGKIILESKATLSAAPDGNGGVYAALKAENVLDDMDKRGVKYVHAYCVDNCLCKVADPVFVGHCVQKNADCGVKVVPKTKWDEPVGVVCLRNGKFAVVEYSEISESVAKQTDPRTGALAFRAGNIANHFYTTDFLKRVDKFENELEYHVAKKKIPYVDMVTGEQVKPKSNSGIKLELFIFDVFPFTERMAVLEVPRSEEFSPLKNASGTPPNDPADNPETSRRDIVAQQVRFVERAGGKVQLGEAEKSLVNACGSPAWEKITFEISPLLTYAGEGLEVYVKGKTITTPAVVNSAEDLKKFAQ